MSKLPGVGEGDEYELRPRADELLYGPEDERIVVSRTEEFERYGFTYPQALELARRRDIDRERVRLMLDQGCIHLLALQIVL